VNRPGPGRIHERLTTIDRKDLAVSKSKKRVLILAVALIALVVGSFSAYAYWTAGGSGSGNAQTLTNTTGLTVNQNAATGLYPGGSVALSGDFTNTNAFPVFVGSVTGSIPTFSHQPDNTKPACTQADFSLSGSAPVNAQIPAGSPVGSWSGYTLSMVNAATNQDNCKSFAVPITYTITP
jgi:hypothetical protein